MQACTAAANAVVKASEDKKVKITEEALQKQRELLIQFQSETRRLQEQSSKTKHEYKHELERMNLAIQQIHRKIIGVGIGQVREAPVIKELQAACREEEFSDEKARKHGADIIAKVRVRSNEVWKIMLSV